MRWVVCILFTAFSVAIEVKKPTVVISVLVRNKSHTLPYFLTLLEGLNYPKDRISLWIRSDHNTDNSVEILQTWLGTVKNQYHSINTEFLSDGSFDDENGVAHWTIERFNHVITLRESALNYARRIWADYLLSLDADAFITNSDTLLRLIKENATLIAPMLRSDGLYSNFWHGMTDDYYYERTEDYKPVLNREKTGCFKVPMIHSCVLIDLRRSESDYLTYQPANLPKYAGPKDDIITFAISAKFAGIPLQVCNDEVYGFIMVPLEQEDTIDNDKMQLTNLKLEILNEQPAMLVGDALARFVEMPKKDTLGFDRIFMINLLRRDERRKRMQHCFDELGLKVTAIDAVDGRELSETFLQGIQFLPEYADPYHKRPMTLGEIGCFMSHYKIWKQIVDEGLKSTLVLEDDIRFEPFFKIKTRNLMEEVNRIKDWDLVYFGRKRLQESDEPWVQGSKYLVEVSYSYWTLGYAISQKGARKLLAAEPLSKLLPVDEYIPILFNKHPQEAWKKHFPERNLVALSAAPLLLYPTHYTGESGYISDTEDSVVVRESPITKEDL